MPEGITLKRIIDMDEAAELTSSDYALVDSATGGPKKFALGNELSSLKEELDKTAESIFQQEKATVSATANDGKLSDAGLWVVDTSFCVDKYEIKEQHHYFIDVDANGGVTYQWQNTATILSYSTIGVVGEPQRGQKFEVIQAPLTATHLMLCRKKTDTGSHLYTFEDVVSYLTDYPKMNTDTEEFIKHPSAVVSKAGILLNGSVYTNDKWSANLGVSDYLLIDTLKGKTIHNMCAWVLATIYPIAFYDANKDVIGTAYAIDSDTSKHKVSLTINDTLLEGYPNAKYIRVSMDSTFGMFISSVGDSEKNTVNQYLLNNYPNAIFCGDSVTEGFVDDVGIYEVEEKYSYPMQFKRQNYGTNVTVVAESGISALGWYNTLMSQADFENNDLIVFEFGYNYSNGGRFNIADWDVANTNTNAYRLIVQHARQDNPKALIILVISSHSAWTYDWKPTLEAIAEESNCYIIDLADTAYLDLDTSEYHIEHDGSVDWAHFTRKGYNAKAFVVKNMILDVMQYQMN